MWLKSQARDASLDTPPHPSAPLHTLGRWDPIASYHRQHKAGARHIAWVMGYERLAGRMLSTSGGFAYELEAAGGGREYVFFPLLAE